VNQFTQKFVEPLLDFLRLQLELKLKTETEADADIEMKLESELTLKSDQTRSDQIRPDPTQLTQS